MATRGDHEFGALRPVLEDHRRLYHPMATRAGDDPGAQFPVAGDRPGFFV